jgi:hypothetical protein
MFLPFQEAAARVAVFQWLEKLSVKYTDVLPRTDLERGCPFASATGGMIQVIGPQGIFKPKDFALPLSITTSPNSPYADSFSGGLLPRDDGTRDKVSSLLNIADGFLGDYLKLHVLATTNVPIHELDPAIIRPGRLTGSREFHRLTRLEAQHIAEAKGFKLVQDQDDYSLAEIYCGASDRPTPSNGRVVGFGQ